MVIASGTARIEGPRGQSEFEGSRLAWLPPGHGGRIRLQAGTRGAHMKVSEVGLAHAMPPGVMNTRLRELLQRHLVLPLPDPDRAAMLAYLETIGSESYATAAGSDIIANSLVSVILVRIWRQVQAETGPPRAIPRSIVDRFVMLVAQHRRDHWAVEDYARTIGVTRDRLGSAIERATGVSPQAYIHRELMSEARDLLMNSGL